MKIKKYFFGPYKSKEGEDAFDFEDEWFALVSNLNDQEKTAYIKFLEKFFDIIIKKHLKLERTTMTQKEFQIIVLQKFDAIDKRLDRIEERLDVIEKRLDVIEERLEGIEKAIINLNKAVFGIAKLDVGTNAKPIFAEMLEWFNTNIKNKTT
ncbi:hypothetical protein [[Acholeplasma] multilocale]|uniref:hypothetical protein n=1 Tax=[Acholeplasma] multilocale TaxID=264638 RepID=UPI00047E5D54|nr:hypothetical protein [[Acholeplasma] multilocale]